MKGSALWIAWKSLQQHALSTWIAAVSIALAGGLLMSVWTLKTEAQNTFTRSNCGFDAVLGPRSSQLQLVLNSIFHMETSPGSIPENTKQMLMTHRDHRIRTAFKRLIPIAVGDNYYGYRLVGTTTELFTEHEISDGVKFRLEGDGKWFDETAKEAVIGSFAAKKLGLQIGDKFNAYHGVNFDKEQIHENEQYTVTGILHQTSTPVDKVIWIPLKGVQTMEGHAESKQNDVSAFLVKLRSPFAIAQLGPYFNNSSTEFTFASITPVMTRFFEKFSWFEKILELVAYLVGIAASGSILAILYNLMNEKRREIAILRSLGARRSTLMLMVIYQSTGIAILGVVLSFAFYSIVASSAEQIIRDQTGVVLELFSFQPVFLWVPGGMLLLGVISGLLPAIVAYQTDVSRNLAPSS